MNKTYKNTDRDANDLTGITDFMNDLASYNPGYPVIHNYAAEIVRAMDTVAERNKAAADQFANKDRRIRGYSGKN